MAPSIAEERIELETTSMDPEYLDPSLAVPVHEQIARLAYSIWQAREGVGGSAEDWVEAEAQLRSAQR
jgi:DUF2934 family protein